MHDPYHAGERLMQERTGLRARALAAGRMIGTAIPPGALGFIAAQRLVVLGARDASGRPWAGVLAGPAGFASATSDGRALHLAAGPDAADPLGRVLPGGLAEGLAVGLLFIEYETRRRLRVSGTVLARDTGGIAITVAQAFPNCPKYIRQAWLDEPVPVAEPELARSGTGALPGDLGARVTAAESFFVASIRPDGGLDVSHRGGAPGFVAGRADGSLEIPDYPGNAMFRTLGNLALDGRAGLVFADLAAGRQVQITGRATLDGTEAAPGTGGRWRLAPDAWSESALNARLPLTPGAPSPFNP